jgi:hypothetical protein
MPLMKLRIIFGSFGLYSDLDPTSNLGFESGFEAGSETKVSDPQHCFHLNAGPDQAHNINCSLNIPEG